MDKLFNQLTKLLEPDKAELVDFDELIGTYSRRKVDAAAKQLDELEQAGLLTYQREDYGFRIKMNKKSPL